MQSMCKFILFIILTMSIPVFAKNYSAVELNRLRLTKLYRNHILIRPLTKNVSYTTVAVGLGIIEVAGIDPQKQVCIKDII